MKLIELLEQNSKVKDVPNSSVGMVLGNLATTVPSLSLPIAPESSGWIMYSDPERISREFEFNTQSHLEYFLFELLKYQESVSHHAKITIDNRKITVETYTHDINSVTKQDTLLSKFCDEIYNDIMFLDRGVM
jgi:pterin-4a-carbinolamine dehydratase